jgi:SAM-dependent methyltransferase
MQGYRPSTYGDAFADVYDEWYPPGEEADRVVDALARLAEGGPVLELGCGTGRLCLPLVDRGLAVVGLDASQAMLDRLTAKLASLPGSPGFAPATPAALTCSAKASQGSLTAVRADMAHFDLDQAPFRLVFSAFNTLFNLATAEGQASCFRSVARHLHPEGRFVVECFVPGDAPERTHDAIELRTLSAERVVLRVSRQDPSEQTVSGQHIELSERHGVRLRPWHLRYATPAQLDQLAADAGLELDERWSDWSATAFTDESIQHVSAYRPSRQLAPDRARGTE